MNLDRDDFQATGGLTPEEMARIRYRVLVGGAGPDAKQEDVILPAIPVQAGPSVSLKSILSELVHQDSLANRLCRKVRPLLDQSGFVTFKKHQATHVHRDSAARVKEIAREVLNEDMF